MPGTESQSFDLYRIFIGGQPSFVLFEILFRTIVIYAYVLAVLRVMGKRGMGQLSPFELTIIIALGSAVGDPMLYPEVPLLHGLAVVTVVVLLTRFVTWLSNRSETVEVYLEGQPCCVVADGELDVAALDGERFSREELFMLLREKGVRQLGQVQRAYLEPSGAVSAFRAPDEISKPGLPILPPYDELTPPPGWSLRGAARTAGETYACWKCGHTEAALAEAEMQACSRCKSDAWAVATRDPLG